MPFLFVNDLSDFQKYEESKLHTMLCCAILYNWYITMLYCAIAMATLCYVVPYCEVLCYAILCYFIAMLCYAMLYYAIAMPAMLCYIAMAPELIAMPCYAVLC